MLFDSEHISANTSDLTDPVCGMSVTIESEHHLQHDHGDYYFCSSGCRDKFAASPESYLNPEPSDQSTCHDDSSQISTTYTCPMHPEVEQQGPDSCPMCGMALEPKGLPVVESKVEYTCPMHPEVVQDSPGSCPKCGMALEAKTITVDEDNAELVDMTRRFWISTTLAFPVFLLAMI